MLILLNFVQACKKSMQVKKNFAISRILSKLGWRNLRKCWKYVFSYSRLLLFLYRSFWWAILKKTLPRIFCSCDNLKKNVDSKWLEDIRPVIQRGPGRGPTPTQLHPRVLPVYWFHYLPCRRHHHGNLLTSLIVIIIIIIIITIITSAQRVPKPDPLASFYFNTRPDSGIRLP